MTIITIIGCVAIVVAFIINSKEFSQERIPVRCYTRGGSEDPVYTGDEACKQGIYPEIQLPKQWY